MEKYRNTIILPFEKNSKFQIIHNIATNSLISANYAEKHSAKDHLGIFVLPSTSHREKEDFAISLSIKEDKDFIIVKMNFFGKNINPTTPTDVTVKLNKTRFYKEDYMEANYLIREVLNHFYVHNFILAN